jgi:WD40 repeat protein
MKSMKPKYRDGALRWMGPRLSRDRKGNNIGLYQSIIDVRVMLLRFSLVTCLLGLIALPLAACTLANPVTVEMRSRMGTDFHIAAIALSPDGNHLAVLTSQDLYLYRADGFQELWFAPVEGRPVDVAFSPDGTLLASKSAVGPGFESTLCLWNAETGQPLRTWDDDYPMSASTSMAFSPDGTVLASGRDSDIVILWDTHTGEMLPEIWYWDDDLSIKFGSLAYSPPWDVAWSPSGERLAFALYDGRVAVWDMEGDEPLYILEGHTQQVWDLAFSPDGTRLASRIWGGTLMLWDLATGEHLHTLEDRAGSGGGVAWSPDGETLASGWGDGTVTLWDAETGEWVRTLEGRPGSESAVLYTQWGPGKTTPTLYEDDTRGLAWSPDGETLLSGAPGEVIVWNPETGERLRTLEPAGVQSVAFSPDGHTLVSGHQNGTIGAWDPESGDLLHTQKAHVNALHGVAFSPDGATLASGAGDEITLWDAETHERLRALEGIGDVNSMTFAPVGTTALALGLEDGEVIVWDVENDERLHTLAGHSSAVRSVASSLSRMMLASGGDDGSVILWNPETGERLYTLERHARTVRSVAFTPDGTTLASGSDDGTMVLWNTETGSPLPALREQPTEALDSLVFSPDGELLAAGTNDGTVLLWDIKRGRKLCKLQEHTHAVRSVAFSPDGTMLATGSSDGTLILWAIAR